MDSIQNQQAKYKLEPGTCLFFSEHGIDTFVTAPDESCRDTTMVQFGKSKIPKHSFPLIVAAIDLGSGYEEVVGKNFK
jgi:hypothetical protein